MSDIPTDNNDLPVNEGAESLVGALKFLFFGLRVVMLILVVLLFRTGCFTVEPTEQVLTFKFGKLQTDAQGEAVYTSGSSKAHWVWPQPIGGILRLPSQSTPLSVEVKRFWHEKGTNVIVRPGEDGEDSTDMFTLGKDGYVITGDSYLYHVRCTLTYYITNAVDFHNSFFGLDDAGNINVEKSLKLADQIIRSHLQDIVVVESSGWQVDEAFYTKLNDYRESIKQRLIKDLEPLKYGITIDRIDIKSEDRAPLQQVRGTFNKVNQANSEAQEEINVAMQKKSEILLKSAEKSTQIRAEGEVYEQSTKSFLAYLQEMDKKYSKNTQDDLLFFYVERITEILENAEHKFVVRKDDQGRDTYWLELGPEKTKTESVDGEDRASQKNK